MKIAFRSSSATIVASLNNWRNIETSDGGDPEDGGHNSTCHHHARPRDDSSQPLTSARSRRATRFSWRRRPSHESLNRLGQRHGCRLLYVGQTAFEERGQFIG
jgi:hypothetical protein